MLLKRTKERDRDIEKGKGGVREEGWKEISIQAHIYFVFLPSN